MWVDIAVYFYRWFRKLSALLQMWLKLFRRTATMFYVVYPDGTQHGLTPETYSAATPLCLLVVYYDSGGVKYRFLETYPKRAPELELADICAAYASYTRPAYAFLALSLIVDDAEHALPPDEFMVEGSILFTPTFNKWLCKHYLYIAPGNNVRASFIDQNVHVCHAPKSVLLLRDTYQLSKDD